MADKKYKLNFTMTDGSERSVEFDAPQGPQGEKGEQGEGVFAFTFRGNETCPVTAAEVYAAVEAGNVCVAIDNIIGRTYVYHGKAPYNEDASYSVPTFVQPTIMGTDSVDFRYMQIDPNGVARNFHHSDVRIANPRKLYFVGAVNKTYDGSQEVTIRIPSETGGSGTATSEGVFVVHFSIMDGTADRTQDEIKTAVSEGKVCIALDAGGHVYVYAGNKTSNSDSTLRVPTFVDNANYEDGTLTIEYVQFYSDGTLETFCREASIGGGAADNIFVINMSLANGTYDTTYDEIRAAINAGKMCIAVDTSGHSYTYVGMQKCTGDVMTLAPTFVDPATINDDTLHIGYIQFFSTGVIERFSRDAELSGGSGLPEPEGPHMQLVTDSDGKAWQQVERTHYEEVLEGDVLLENTPTLDPDAGSFIVLESFVSKLVLGDTYTVTWNGTPYTCTAQETEMSGYTCTYLGNGAVIGGDNTGEPFGIIVLPDEVSAAFGGASAVISPLDGSSEVTIKITGSYSIVHKIDEKYLPSFANGNILNGLGSGSLYSKNSFSETGENSVALGDRCKATGDSSVAIGAECTVSVGNSTAIGYCNTVKKGGCAAIGQFLTIGEKTSIGQVVLGMYNAADDNAALIVASGAYNTPKNLFTVNTYDGSGWFLGTVEGTALILKSSTSGSTKRFKITVDDSGTLSAAEITE